MALTEEEVRAAFHEMREAIDELRVSVCQLSVDLNLIWAAYTQKQPQPTKKVTKAVAGRAAKKGTKTKR